jgi:L-ascorbate metabolism protein UlaG (beta-lactamase superfamily)
MADGAVNLTWLGQVGFLVETAGLRILVDPWLSPHEGRLIDPPPLELVTERIDAVLVTHEHDDHLDLPFLRQLAARSPETRLILPAPAADLVGDLLPATGVRPGDELDVGGLRVEVVPAWHGIHVADGYTDGGGRFVGYVLRGGGPVLYHSGDTIATPELLAALEGKGVEVALLPINGRDFFREELDLSGNLDTREAVRLARRIGARVLVPMHWDAYAGNTESPGRAADDAAAEGGLHVLVLARLVPFRLAR